MCQVSAPELFSAHHAAAHIASEPSLRVSQSLGVSQPGRAPPADCPVDETKATLSAYDELPVEIGDRLTQRAQAAGPVVHQTG